MGNLFAKPKPRKCLLVGDSGTGKTTFVNRHLTSKFLTEFDPTVGVGVVCIEIATNRGSVEFELWDTAGRDDLKGLGNGYYFFSDCAIIMFDVGSYESCMNVCKWRQDIENICGKNIPIVVCGNKVDLEREYREVPLGSLRFQSGPLFEYFAISTLSKFNIDLPFQWLCGKMLGNDNLYLISQPEMGAPDVEIPEDERKEIIETMEAVKMGPHDDCECKCSFVDHEDCEFKLRKIFEELARI